MDVLALDTWVLSCRAFGRGIEYAIYEHVTAWGRNKGCHKLRAPFVPNSRNALVSNLLTSLGARKISQEGEIAIYESDVLTGCPHYLRIVEAETATQ
jgi:predicted enzyme involved in methoxymalonyl-ACP biosynthesis